MTVFCGHAHELSYVGADLPVRAEREAMEVPLAEDCFQWTRVRFAKYCTVLTVLVQYKIQRQVRLVEQVDMGTLGSWSCAHLVDRPLPIICPKGWVF